MNKKLKVAGLALASATIIGWFGVQHTGAAQEDPVLNTNDVEQMVKEQYNGKVTALELEKKQGRAVYEMEVHDDRAKYELLVDADAGEILKEKTEKKLIITEKAPIDNDATTQKAEDKQDTQVEAKQLSPDEEKASAVKEFDGKVIQLEHENDDGRKKYEVEVQNENKKTELDMDTKTGEVLKKEMEEKKVAPPVSKPAVPEKAPVVKEVNNKQADVKQEKKSAPKLLSGEEAKAIALKKFNGKITDFELDEDDGRMVYEIEIEAGNAEAEIEMDAKTGKILEIDIDRDDD